MSFHERKRIRRFRHRTNPVAMKLSSQAKPFGLTSQTSWITDRADQPNIVLNMDAKEFATWRQQVGITQEELANRWARVTRTTIQNWESGATPIPEAAATACQIWERRSKQENPNLGPVTLIYADGPMFVDAYRPGRLSMLKQEPYATNASALARVLELWEHDDFCNPFIIEKSGADLWNGAELRRVAIREDSNAPTLVNLLKRLSKKHQGYFDDLRPHGTKDAQRIRGKGSAATY